jgi:hypothetical protein
MHSVGKLCCNQNYLLFNFLFRKKTQKNLILLRLSPVYNNTSIIMFACLFGINATFNNISVISWQSKKLVLFFFLPHLLGMLHLSRLWSYDSWILNYLCLSPLMLWVRILIRARCTTLCDKVCQWLVTDLWLSPGPPVSSINKTDCHDITEILLKVALIPNKQTNIMIEVLLYTGESISNINFFWFFF